MRVLSGLIDDGACGLYRVKQPLMKIAHQFGVEIDFMQKGMSDEMLLNGLLATDVLVIRPGKDAFVKLIHAMRDSAEKSGDDFRTKIVFDHDDNTLDINPFSNHYADSGIKEVRLDDVMPDDWFEEHPEDRDKYLWKDGEAEFDLQRNRQKSINMLEGMAKSDMVTATTDTLANFYKSAAPQENVRVLPNCLDFEHWKRADIRGNDLRISWHGGSSHFVDVLTIRDRLMQVVNREGYKYVHVGQEFEKWDEKFDRYEHHSWVPTPAHPYRMALLNIDIGVIPLADISFNDYKSDIKWVEYSALKVPCVVRNRKPYSESIEHGVTGFLYDSEDEFEEYVLKLAKDKNLRREIGENAYQWVRENRDADKLAYLWLEAYASLLDGQD